MKKDKKKEEVLVDRCPSCGKEGHTLRYTVGGVELNHDMHILLCALGKGYAIQYPRSVVVGDRFVGPDLLDAIKIAKSIIPNIVFSRRRGWSRKQYITPDGYILPG